MVVNASRMQPLDQGWIIPMAEHPPDPAMIGNQGLVASWNETNRGNKFLTTQLKEPTHASHHALSVVDLQEVSTGFEDWLAEVREDPKFFPNAMAVLFAPLVLQQKMRNPWVRSCWQSSQSLPPDDLAGVLGTFLRVCVPFSGSEAEDCAALYTTSGFHA